MNSEKLRGYIKIELEKMLNNISKKKNWDYNELIDLFKSGIVLQSKKDKSKSDDKLCVALVTSNNMRRRCSRKYKFDCYCGLHYNKLKKTGHIEHFRIENNVIDTIFLDRKIVSENIMENKFIDIDNCFSSVNTILDINNFKPIEFGKFTYYVNILNDLVYEIDFDEYIVVGKFSNGEILSIKI